MTRHQAHPIDEPPDDWRKDLQACALGIALLVVLTILAIAWPPVPR
jgi:hypothetical protein